ncbi:hypothetical protein [Chondromyces crocatus]|nr:hypothetical protein [Chondromyces crocatus]
MPQSLPAHLAWGKLLVDNILPQDNRYGDGSSHYIRWAGIDGYTRYENNTQCNSLLTHLLRQAYGLDESDMLAWTEQRSPTAHRYHDLIEAEDGWTIIPRVSQIRAGDVLAIRYTSHPTSTGHIAIVQRAPIPRQGVPQADRGVTEYEVHVLDSTSTKHGNDDSRVTGSLTQKGVGTGVMRFYTDVQDRITGHAWSMISSEYHPQSERHAVVGRLDTQGLTARLP